jgi:predicted nucleic acid-binding protein
VTPVDGVVLDASVFVADAVTAEAAHTDANSLLEALAARGVPILAPCIVMPEVAAALARGVDDPQLASQATGLYRRWPGLELVPVDEALAELAVGIAAEQRIRGCDAVYVALALWRGATLISLDRQQRLRTPPEVKVATPREALAALAPR